MSDEEDEMLTQYMVTLDDDETQNYRVETNRHRRCLAICNINAM